MTLENFIYEDNPWLFNGEILRLEDYPKYEGFVYLIIDTETSKQYIGRKYFYSLKKLKKSARRKRSESDWKEYFSSSNVIKSLVSEFGHKRFKRIVLSLCLTRGDANYMEKKLQFLNNVLESDEWYNDCIGSQRTVSKRILDARIMSNAGEFIPLQKHHIEETLQLALQCQMELPF